MFSLYGEDCPFNKLSKDEIYHRALDLVMVHYDTGDIWEWVENVNHDWPFGFAIFYYCGHCAQLLRCGAEVTRQRLQEI